MEKELDQAMVKCIMHDDPWFDNASVLPVLVDLLCAGTCGAKIVTAATVTVCVCVIAWCLMLSTLMSLYSVALGFSHVGVMTMS